MMQYTNFHLTIKYILWNELNIINFTEYYY